MKYPKKPYKCRRWRHGTDSYSGSLYTCARPGRTKDEESKHALVPDSVVRRWALGLPGPDEVVVVSLLGRKPDDTSEFTFYTFHGLWDTEEERRGRPSFEEFLQAAAGSARTIKVVQHPTIDFEPVPDETVAAVGVTLEEELAAARTVILVDSGGEQRTNAVCKRLGFIEYTTRQDE
jgi:hypothetical protein